MDATRKVLLIVEDHEPTRRLLSTILGREGWKVMTAATAAEGLSLLDWEPECLVLDLGLPDAFGERLLQRVREALPRTRVVVVTGLGDDARMERVKQLRPEAILNKPIEVNQFLKACSLSGP